MTPTDLLREKLITCAADNKKFVAQILEIAELYNQILSTYELELLKYQVELSKQIKQERKLLDILETYGIDLATALSRSDNQIESDYDLAINCGVCKVPEKLTNKISYD